MELFCKSRCPSQDNNSTVLLFKEQSKTFYAYNGLKKILLQNSGKNGIPALGKTIKKLYLIL